MQSTASNSKPTAPQPRRALVLFSGGQDSATCLVDALQRFDEVQTIGFDYGQRHAVELTLRLQFLAALRAQFPLWARRLGADHVLRVDTLKQLGASAMTDDVAIALQANGLPNTFVPGRNLLFLTLAAALAYRQGIKTVITGVCETDYSGYPDCRDDTIKALQVALNLGLETRLVLETPLMWLSKAQTWQLAHMAGGEPLVELMREHTHTCYLGQRGEPHNRHGWGYGCGSCPACELRSAGYEQYVRYPAILHKLSTN